MLLPREGAVRMAVTPFLVLGIAGVILGLVGLFTPGASERSTLAGMVLGGVILLALYKGLREFKAWARIPGLVVAALLCVATIVAMVQRARRPEPFQTAILLFCSMPLFLLTSKASAFLFTPDYSAVVRATPHLRYRTPPAVLISITLLIVAVAAIVWWNVEVRGGRSV